MSAYLIMAILFVLWVLWVAWKPGPQQGEAYVKLGTLEQVIIIKADPQSITVLREDRKIEVILRDKFLEEYVR